jgi:hypothetical protein
MYQPAQHILEAHAEDEDGLNISASLMRVRATSFTNSSASW